MYSQRKRLRFDLVAEFRAGRPLPVGKLVLCRLCPQYVTPREHSVGVCRRLASKEASPGTSHSRYSAQLQCAQCTRRRSRFPIYAATHTLTPFRMVGMKQTCLTMQVCCLPAYVVSEVMSGKSLSPKKIDLQKIQWRKRGIELATFGFEIGRVTTDPLKFFFWGKH